MISAQVLQALIGALLGAVGTYLGLYWRVRKELEAQYDSDLRSARLKTYAELWKLLQPLAKYSRPGPVTLERLRALATELRIWYFEVGGLYMSGGTRDAYFALQDELRRLVPSAAGPDRELTDAEFEALRLIGSRLRTATTFDVGSRRRPLLGYRATA